MSMMCGKLSKRFKFSTVNFILLLVLIQYGFSAPVENLYVKFINDLNSNACATPEQIKLPSNSSSATNFELLSSSLNICQNLETAARIKEAQYLCGEIFNNLKVVLCPNSKGTTKPLNITFSMQVCKDIASLKNVSDKLLKHLADTWACEMLCDAEFEKACQVLHWSYQTKKDFEGNENINSKSITGNPTGTIILGSDKQKFEEPNKTKEKVQKTAEVAQEQTKDTVPHANPLVLSTQKINSVVEQQMQNQADNLQPDLNSNVKATIQINPKDAITNSILPVLRGNISRNEAPKPPQEDVLSNNHLPENEIPGNTDGVPEIEDPHDNDGVFSHNVEPDVVTNKEPSKPAINNQLPNVPADIKVPNIPANHELLPPTANDLSLVNQESTQLNPNNRLVDTHNGEELGEVESPVINPKAPVTENKVVQTEAIKIEITHQNGAEVQTQEKLATTQNGSATTKTSSSTTKAASSTGRTKSTTTAVEEKAIEVKSSSAGVLSSLSTDGKKTTVSVSSVPSMKEASSSVISPISEDLSPPPMIVDKMEEEEPHENPEDREQPDQYIDLEKTEGGPDDDYARQEYDGNYESAKNKEIKPEKTSEVSNVDVGGPREQTLEEEFSPKSKYGPDDVPLIPVVFPEQEDGHFFFYFLSMVLILMAGYLIFHNKQKIIALIVEGRHERRRRSHGAGYKKLETK